MSQNMSKREIKQRLEEALAHARKGEYNKASYLLREIDDHPAAQKLLKQMEGRHDRIDWRQFFNLPLLLVIVLVVVSIFVIFSAVTGLQESFIARDQLYVEFRERGLSGNDEYFVDLAIYCRSAYENTSPQQCLDWAEMVYTQYDQQVRLCIYVDDDGFNLSEPDREPFFNCLTEGGIPAPAGT